MAWKMMLYAPRDKEIVVVTADRQIGVARWINPEKPYGRFFKISGWCIGDKAVKPILWTEQPSEHEIDIGLHA